MLIPSYWAEHRLEGRHPQSRRRIVVRRWGWSMQSQAAAEAHAQERATMAMAQRLSGHGAPWQEASKAYGVAGVPIREEVLEVRPQGVMTRNRYGARCLNTDALLIADVDFSESLRWRVLWGYVQRLLGRGSGDPLSDTRRRVEHFVLSRPDWRVRLYRTPAGVRLLAVHRPFEVHDPEVQAFFAAINADPQYVRLCMLQRCFRARVSAKPWRISSPSRLSPKRLPVVGWPLSGARRVRYDTWVAQYEREAARFAACAWIGDIGQGVQDPALNAVVAWHDEASGVLQVKPLA